MLDIIEKSQIVIDFDYNYLMRKNKVYITNLYNRSLEYMKRGTNI